MDVYLRRYEGIFGGMRKTRIVKETIKADQKFKIEYTYEFPS